jgi:hypothetical protein
MFFFGQNEKWDGAIEILELGTGPSNILGKRTPCKKLADLLPRQGNLLQRSNFSAAYKTSLHFTKLGGDQLKKISLFQTCCF